VAADRGVGNRLIERQIRHCEPEGRQNCGAVLDARSAPGGQAALLPVNQSSTDSLLFLIILMYSSSYALMNTQDYGYKQTIGDINEYR
jgi:hypothetical protein